VWAWGLVGRVRHEPPRNLNAPMGARCRVGGCGTVAEIDARAEIQKKIRQKRQRAEVEITAQFVPPLSHQQRPAPRLPGRRRSAASATASFPRCWPAIGRLRRCDLACALVPRLVTFAVGQYNTVVTERRQRAKLEQVAGQRGQQGGPGTRRPKYLDMHGGLCWRLKRKAPKQPPPKKNKKKKPGAVLTSAARWRPVAIFCGRPRVRRASCSTGFGPPRPHTLPRSPLGG